MNLTTSTLIKNLDEKTNYQLYLRLELNQATSCVLPMKYAQEVLVLPSTRITPMPNMPSCIFGLLNQRSRIFWVADLPQLLELEPVDRRLQEYHLTIIRVDNVPLGLIVPKISGTIRLNPDEIQSPLGNVSAGLIPYLQGCLMQEEAIFLLLDAEAIINSHTLHLKH
jgi:twitching motility protein PilI